MTDLTNLPRYDAAQTYDWNYAHAPEPVEVDVPALRGAWDFCGLKVASPLGVAAGPLLNGRWVRYYASLGFDVLTYKTVRSVERACYAMPNLVPVDTSPLAGGQMAGGEASVPAAARMGRTWAVSFGMPSKAPEVWRADVEETRKLLTREKVLVVSVVATEQPGWTIDDMAADYARCAQWAVESGADAVETNFSCPNVCTSDGQLYQQPADAARCAAAVREAIGRTPYVVKVGHIRNAEEAAALTAAIGPFVDGLAMTNSVAAPVRAADGTLLFDGAPRGICGAAILEASLAQTRMVRQVVTQRYLREAVKPAALVGVGGAFSAEDVRRYLVAGAASVHLATAVMVEPGVALAIRAGW